MNYQSARLIDDDWVILLLDASREPATPPRLVLLNTKQTTTDDKTFAQTTFNFDPHDHTDLGVVGLHFELGGYEPSLEEGLLAPFYPDTSQRVLTVEFATSGDLFVMRVETLLRLARARGGGDLQWEEWQAHVVRVQYRGTRIYNLWVSGARLFCIYSAELEFRKAVLDMYDFSAQASGKYTEATKGGTVQRAARPSITHNLPWIAPTIGFASSGHDSIAILVVIAPCLLGSNPKLTQLLYIRTLSIVETRSSVHSTCGTFDSHCFLASSPEADVSKPGFYYYLRSLVRLSLFFASD